MLAYIEEIEDDSVDVFELGSLSGYLWRSDSEIIAGLGHIHEFVVDSLTDFQQIEEYLNNILVDSTVANKNILPIALTAIPFNVNSLVKVYIPEIVLFENMKKRYLIIVSDSDPVKLAQNWKSKIPSQLTFSELNKLELVDSVNEDYWSNHMVNIALDSINSTVLDKVVLARQKTFTSGSDFNLNKIITSLKLRFPTTNLFCVNNFFGASPEILITKSNKNVWALPLAGTESRGTNDLEDQSIKKELLRSPKNSLEHKITIDWFLDTLLPFCSYVDADPEPKILELENVFHLATKVHGLLASESTTILELIRVLHPTPAVGGDPQGPALELIERLEPVERDLFAGPVGWFNSQGDGSFAVAIRSAKLIDESVTLFAGVGIVSSSDPHKEFLETEAKFEAVYNSLND